MEIMPKQATRKGAGETFVGDVWIDDIVRGEDPSRLRASIVRFTPGARNAWHVHAVGQTVHVTEGLGLIQARDRDPILIRAGDTICTPPGEWHWHGAAPNQFMTHIAIWEAPAEGDESAWGDLVSDAEYEAAGHAAGARMR